MPVRTKTRKVTAPIKMTEKQMLQELYAYINLCFQIFADEVDKGEHMDLKELANRTSLSVSTLNRLALHNVTLAVRHGTIRKLAAVAGVGIEWTPTGSKCIIVSR